MGQGADLARHRARDGVVEGEQLPDGRQAAELRRQRAGEVVGVEEEVFGGARFWKVMATSVNANISPSWLGNVPWSPLDS